jgi:ribonuclease BN (tRNA processing enzyme)
MSADTVVTFLGTGDAFGSGGRLQTCFHVQTPESAFLIDCGATACLSMKRHGIRADDLDAVLVSHFHADHFAGVAFLLLESRVVKRSRRLVLGGPPGLGERVETSMNVLFPGAGTGYEFPIEYHEYPAAAPVDVGVARVTAFPVEHAPSTMPHALRIEVGDLVIAYSGDTQWTDTLVEVARGADLFICEVSGYDGPNAIHLDYTTLLEHRAAFDCRRLVLTHMGEDVLAHVDQVAERLDARAASDGLVIRI